MNRTFRIAAIVTLLAGIGIATGAAVAGGDHCGPGARFGADSKQRAEGKLSRLHDELRLAPEQEAGWREFSAVVTAQADVFGERVREWRAAARPAKAIERLERGQQGLEQGSKALADITAATKRFYATLTPEQQTRFDEATSRFVPGRFGPGRFGFGGHRDGAISQPRNDV